MTNKTKHQPYPRQLPKYFYYAWAMFVGVTMIIALIYLTLHPDVVTMTFTNIGFAVFVALANISFGWARTFTDVNHLPTVKRINRIGYFCIFCGITFILSSLFQFIIVQLTEFTKDDSTSSKFVYVFIAVRYVLIISFLSISLGILYEMLSVIYKLLFTEYIKIDFKSIKNHVIK